MLLKLSLIQATKKKKKKNQSAGKEISNSKSDRIQSSQAMVLVFTIHPNNEVCSHSILTKKINNEKGKDRFTAAIKKVLSPISDRTVNASDLVNP